MSIVSSKLLSVSSHAVVTPFPRGSKTCFVSRHNGCLKHASSSAHPQKCSLEHVSRTSQPRLGRAVVRVRASSKEEGSVSDSDSSEKTQAAQKAENGEKESIGNQTSINGGKKFGGGNLFDPAATISRFITRRFGLAGGLAFVALLASTEGYEIVKTLLEKEETGSGELVELPSGLAYRDFKIGGGPMPKKGDFVGMSIKVSAGEETLLDTKESKRPIAWTYGAPYTSVVCAGLEEGLLTMRRGGIREIVVPPELAFGSGGKALPNMKRVAPGATLVYTVNLEDVTGSYL